jgi:2-polyprenyl-3-methyl-5-hydroxy-6-metoxy-1,4-benzoquinol methylase
MTTVREEISRGERFGFGKNWSKFLSLLGDERVLAAERSLTQAFDCVSLAGHSFLDAGSGSGIFSLAARRLGAHVHSFDYDPESVACTSELKRRYFPDDTEWTIEEGSLLDLEYMLSLPKFDIVYSWGVLHHTGALWQALANVEVPVAAGGRLCVAIYNDQGIRSHAWRKVKQLYCSGTSGKIASVAFFVPYFIVKGLIYDALLGKNPISRYTDYKVSRGMAIVTDYLDWLGGYPFEVAKPEEVIEFCDKKGFRLKKLRTCGGSLGNNEYVFERIQ